ncbi:zinc ribbon domain-containing protein [Microseira sp. BLCC-F43]|uniref:zinc ribbon domain-containing protein n=1 Tax=Microseira sp. BLCC-F43 TaxID=3153602 RepID=UPI0035B76975
MIWLRSRSACRRHQRGKVTIKINPKYSSTECRKCGHTDASNRDGEKFICDACGFYAHADITAS